jgi:glycosyltransferase involved in cell wall biosynthesis
MNARLRVGIDARVLTETAPLGVSRYLAALLRATAELEPHNEYLLYVCSPSLTEAPFTAEPFRQRVLMGNAVLAKPLVWQQLYFPWQAWRDRVDVLFSPYYSGPLFSPMPQVVCLHDISFSLFPQDSPSWIHFKPKFLAWPSSRRAARVTTVSEFSRQEIVRVYGLAPEKVVVIPAGTEEQLWRRTRGTAAKAVVHRDAPFFLFVGSLRPRRQVGLVIQALAQLPAHSQLVVVGESDPTRQATVVSTARQWHVAERVHCLGHVTDEELEELYRRAIALVSPSTYEGFGLPVLEALSRGLPVIAWDIPVVREVAGDAAVLLQSGDVAGLVTAMRQVESDATLRQTLCQAGKARAGKFSWRRSAAAFLAVLCDAAGKRQASLHT